MCLKRQLYGTTATLAKKSTAEKCLLRLRTSLSIHTEIMILKSRLSLIYVGINGKRQLSKIACCHTKIQKKKENQVKLNCITFSFDCFSLPFTAAFSIVPHSKHLQHVFYCSLLIFLIFCLNFVLSLWIFACIFYFSSTCRFNFLDFLFLFIFVLYFLFSFLFAIRCDVTFLKKIYSFFIFKWQFCCFATFGCLHSSFFILHPSLITFFRFSSSQHLAAASLSHVSLIQFRATAHYHQHFTSYKKLKAAKKGRKQCW